MESSADTHPSTHLGHGGLGVQPLASVWTVGDHPGLHTEVRIKQDFTSVPESSWLRRKLHRKVQQTHTPPHLGHGGLGERPLASVWTFGDHSGSQTEVRIKHDFTSVPFLKLPGCGENCDRKFSCFSVRVGACCTGLPAGLPIKSLILSLQPVMDTATPLVDTT